MRHDSCKDDNLKVNGNKIRTGLIDNEAETGNIEEHGASNTETYGQLFQQTDSSETMFKSLVRLDSGCYKTQTEFIPKFLSQQSSTLCCLRTYLPHFFFGLLQKHHYWYQMI